MDKFRRVEIKYLLNQEQYKSLMENIKNKIKKDKFHKSTICNVYLDTDDYYLINNSIEKSSYKEKLRIRSYGIPTLEDKVYLEIKKKFAGVVGKRRISVKLKDLYSYFDGNIMLPDEYNNKEIDYIIKKHKLKYKFFVAYDRLAYTDINNNELRITFDSNLRSRKKDLKLENGDSGDLFFEKPTYIMEIKVLGSMPLWLSKKLSELKIYPTSFSKIGEIYKRRLIENV